MKRIRWLALKEFYHIIRDVRSLMIVIAMPILMTAMYGYAISLDIDNITLAVIDHDRTSESRSLVERFYASGRFVSPLHDVDLADPTATLRRGDAVGILVIRPGFSEAVAQTDDFTLGLTLDGSDASVANAAQAYVSTIVAEFTQDRLLPPGAEMPGIRISQTMLYNPDLKSAHFFVPGLVAVILLMISALLTSITIAREKESGTMEQLLTTPVRPHEIMIGKLLPYIVIAFLDGLLVVLFALVVFGVPFAGSVGLLIGFGIIYVAASLAIGMLVSSIAKTQQVAMMIALAATLMPSVMLSGFVFAIKNMPPALQAISHIVPAKYFVTIIRGIMLKGSSIEVLIVPALSLIAILVVLMFIATRRFQTRLA